MSGAADRQQPQSTPPSADQLRMFLQSMQQQFQSVQQQSNNSGPTKSGDSNTNVSEKQSPALDENNVFNMLMSNPEYQRMMNYGQMSQAQAAPIQHPLAAAAANPENPAFRALIAHSSGGSGLPFGVYPNFVPDMHPEMLAANPYYANGMPFPYMGAMDAGRRKNATREVTMPLKKWLNDHRKYPYPNKAEKMILAIITKMSLTQVSTWFANARRRLKKENKMTWSPRGRPGDEDDDDDLGDVDNEPLSPSISINSADELKRDGPMNNSFEDQKGTKRAHPEGSHDEAPTPKRKILSVSDMLSGSRQSPSRTGERCKSPRSTTPPSSSSNGTAENTPSMLPGMPPLGQFPPTAGQGFPFPFMPGANPQAWNPQMMAMLAAMPQNAAARNSAPFNAMPQMNPNFLQQMMAVQMANFMRSNAAAAAPTIPPQLNPAMLAAMQGFFPSTSTATTTINSAPSPSTKTTSTPANRPNSAVAVNKSEHQPQSPSVVNTSSSSVSEGNVATESTTNSATTTTANNDDTIKKSEDVESSPQPQSVAAH